GVVYRYFNPTFVRFLSATFIGIPYIDPVRWGILRMNLVIGANIRYPTRECIPSIRIHRNFRSKWKNPRVESSRAPSFPKMARRKIARLEFVITGSDFILERC